VRGRAVDHLGGEAIARGGRAVEVVGIDFQWQRLFRRERRGYGIERELETLGQEFLDPEGEAAERFLRGWIETVFESPFAGSGIARNRALVGVVAQFPGGERHRRHRASIGLAQCGVKGLPGFDRATVVVAQQRRHLQRFAGSEQVASGPGVDILRRLGATGDRELGQVQRGLAERDQRDLAAAARDQYVLGLGRVVEAEVALGIGLAACEHHAILVHHLHRDARARIAVGQRSRMQPELAALHPCMQAEITDVVVRRFHLTVEHTGAFHHRDVEPRRLQFGDGLYRQEAHAALVRRRPQREAVRVDRFGDARERTHLPVAA
jgi:hypothetical protein